MLLSNFSTNMKCRGVFLFIYLNFYSIVDSQLGSNCMTPNGEKTFCFPLHKCDQLKQSLFNPSSSTEKFFNASICGSLNSTEPLVCCGLLSDYKTIDYASWILDTLPSHVKISEILPPRTICGRQIFQDRIFGGNETGIDEFPWMALMEYKNKFGDISGYQCGGVLISSRYVLTAAHCVVGEIEQASGKLFRVRLGEHDIRTEIDCVTVEGELDCAEAPQDYYVEQAVVHENHLRNFSGTFNDIALLRLAKAVNFTDFIKPICLPLEQERSNAGEKLMVAGWGAIDNGTYSPVKLKVDLNLIDRNDCAQLYSRYNVSITNGQLCAFGGEGKDTCSGDSGGPLMNTLPNNKTIWYVEGIVSFGPRDCASGILPGVYASVTDFIDWIVHNIKE